MRADIKIILMNKVTSLEKVEGIWYPLKIRGTIFIRVTLLVREILYESVSPTQS